jgi:diguanylate cyclase (GGDEF)-like protein/PAS domain S-box-containing protein
LDASTRVNKTFETNPLYVDSKLKDCIVIVDPLSISFASNAFCKLTGYSKEYLQTMTSFFDLVASEDRKNFQESFLNNFKQRKFLNSYISKIQKSSGEFIQTRIHPYYLESEPHAKVLMIIQEQMEMNSDIQSEVFSKSLFQDYIHAMIICEKSNGHILAANQQALHLYDFPAKEFLKMNFDDLEMKENNLNTLELNDSDIQNIFDGKLAKHRKKDQTSFDAEVMTTEIVFQNNRCYLRIIRDVTKTANLVNFFYENNEKLKLIFNNGVHQMTLFDKNYRVLDINAVAKREFLKLFKREIKVGDIITELLPPAFQENFSKKIKNVFQKNTIIEENSFKEGNGQEIWYETMFSPIINKRGTVTGCLLIAWPTTNNKKTEIELKKTEQKFRSLFDCVNDSIFVYEISANGIPGNFIEVNQIACNRLGYSREELLKLSVQDLDDTQYLDIMKKIWKDIVVNKKKVTIEKNYISKSGMKLPVEVTLHLLEWENQNIIFSVARDIQERKRTEETIRRQAYYDPLTNLPNRILFKDRLEQLILNADHENQKIAIAVLDLDRFKTINETLGHVIGDKLLIGVAERLINILYSGETISRFGGDEFTILFPYITKSEEINKFAQKIIDALKEPFFLGSQELHLTTSIGITIYPNDGQEAEVLLKNAETAMYRAKEQGRNNYQLYNSLMNATAFKQLLMENNLRRALEKKEFVVYYQPQYDLKTHKLTGAEALIRWKHPDLGIIFPTEFISLAEETGIIIEIGEWVIENVFTQVKTWELSRIKNFCVYINLSGRQFLQQNLFNRIDDILRKTQVNPNLLGLEITESVAMKNPDLTSQILSNFKKKGFRLSLDDFGTGYSSLSYLKSFPLHVIKIDQSFVRDITSDANDAAIVSAVVALAHSLNLNVVAEGVETQEQLEFLTTKGCDQAQGYLLGHPLPIAEFEKLLLK